MHDDNLIEAMAIMERMQSYDTEGKDPLAASALRQWAGEVRDALAALQREQWVPVSERLPSEGVDVLVLSDYGQIVGSPAHRDCGRRYGYRITRRYGNGFLSDFLETGKVTHWMPLPPAPQPEEAP